MEPEIKVDDGEVESPVETDGEVDYSKLSLEDLAKQAGAPENDDDVIDNQTGEEPAEPPEPVKSSAKKQDDEPAKTGEKDTDFLKQTPYQSTEQLVKGYKEIQSRATKAEIELRALQDRLTEIESEEPEPGKKFEDPTAEDGDSFLTVKQFNEKIEEAQKKYETAEQKRVVKEAELKTKEKVTADLMEANQLPDYGKNKEIIAEVMNNPEFANICNPKIKNPLVFANQIINDGLLEIFRENPGLFLSPDGGIKSAKAIMKAQTLPEDIKEQEEVKKIQDKVRKQKEQAKLDSASVGLSGASKGDPQKDYKKMNLGELAKEVGVDMKDLSDYGL